jgi:acetyltransferase
MKYFFQPGSIAVAGASTDPEKLGSIIFSNLLANVGKGILRASVYPLNPTHDTILGKKCYASLVSMPEPVELLIVAVPMSMSAKLVKEAGKAGVKAVVMITSGYAEVGREDLQRRIKSLAETYHMRILGPNTIGILDTMSGVDSLFLRPTKKLPDGGEIVSLIKPLKGDIAIITQSGHLGEVIAEELASEGIGIRALVGTGNQLDVSVEDVMDYFAEDRSTGMIALYLEGVHDGRRFMAAATRAVRRKPLVVFKVGKTGTGARAALTHTASLAGNYRVYQAAFSQAGVVEAQDLQELVDYCLAFATLRRIRGRRLAIITNAGGVGAIAADAAERAGLEVPQPGVSVMRRMRSEFSETNFISNASLRNPFDLTATATTDEFAQVVNLVLKLPDYDMALILPTHQTPAMNYDAASKVFRAIQDAGKPACVSVMGSSELATKMHREFIAGGVPSFPTPERAVRTLSFLASYDRLRERAAASREGTGSVPLAKRRRTTTGANLKYLLSLCGIEEPGSVLVRSARELKTLKAVRFPVACKLLSRGLAHKTDVGGVLLNISDLHGAASAFLQLKSTADKRGIPFGGVLVQEMVSGGVETILGGSRDPTFGPVVLFGVGGTYTELLREFSIAIAPVGAREARRMVEENPLGKALQGYRGGPRVAIARLGKSISAFSRILVENESIKELEVNPLTLSGRKLLAVDARMIESGRRSRRNPAV